MGRRDVAQAGRSGFGADFGDDGRLEVALGPVGKQRDDHARLLVGGQLFRDADAARQRRARRVADQQPLFLGQAIGDVPGLVRVHGQDAVQLVGVVDARDDRAGHVLQPLEAVQGIGGLDGEHLDVAPVLFQPAPGAHHGAGRADAGHEVRDAPFGLLPDLAPGRVVVPQRVRQVRVLIRVEVLARVVGDDLAAQANRAVGALHRVAEDQLRSEGLRDLLARPRDVARHHQRHRKPERAADQRVGHARVAAGRVDDRLPVAQEAGADRVPDHLVGGAILDGAARVEELALGPQLDAGRVALERSQPHDRRITDQVRDSLGHTKPRALDELFGIHGRPPMSCAIASPPSTGKRR